MRKNIKLRVIRLFLIPLYLASVQLAQAQSEPVEIENDYRTFYLGINIGQGAEFPNIDSTSTSDEGYFGFTDSPQPSLYLGIFAEKQITDLVHVLGGVDLNFTSFSTITEFPGKSVSSLAGLGATIGYIHRPRSWYFSFLVGYSTLKISDSGNPDAEPESCSIFLCTIENPPLQGASSTGIGFRLTAGISLNHKLRLSAMHTRVGGDATDLSDGSTAKNSYTGLMLSATFK